MESERREFREFGEVMRKRDLLMELSEVVLSFLSELLEISHQSSFTL